MSWLARSLANSLRLDDDEDDEEQENDGFTCVTPERETRQEIPSPPSIPSPEEEAKARGVKEDLTELKQTLSRKLWGVANFLAPTPDTAVGAEADTELVDDLSALHLDRSERSNGSVSGREEEASNSAAVSWMGSHPEKIGGRLRSGVLNGSLTASDYFTFESEANVGENEVENVELEKEKEEEEEEEEDTEIEEEEDEEITLNAIGITDEVLAFARNIAMHPETWLDFPLDPDEDLDDFDMSKTQQDHVLIIERLAPRLAALRIELCPCHMSKSYFWKVYFVLLHSRLNKKDSGLLSTPQVMETRALWMQELQKQKKADVNRYKSVTSSLTDNNYDPKKEIIASSRSYRLPEFLSPSIYSFEPPPLKKPDYRKMAKYPVENAKVNFIDKSVIVEETVFKTVAKKDYEDDDDWPEEEDSENVDKALIGLGNEEDISFSDLEDDDEGDVRSLPEKPKALSGTLGMTPRTENSSINSW